MEKFGSEVEANTEDSTGDDRLAFSEAEGNECVEFYSARLEFLWGKYLTLPNLLATTSGGTLLVFFNSIKFENLSEYTTTAWMHAAILTAGMALICAFIWRYVSQHFVELEVLGSKDDVNHYFKICRIDHVTQSHNASPGRNALFQKIYWFAPKATTIFLLTAWICIYIFIWQNS